MNNEIFKKFIAPYFDNAVRDLKPIFKNADDLSNHVPFVAGFVCGGILATAGEINLPTDWRDKSEPLSSLTHEEVRRVFDYCRLRLETGSVTS